jgi:hypothetical protein
MLLCKQISIFFPSMLSWQVHLSLFYYFLKNKFYYSLSWLTFKFYYSLSWLTFDPLSLSLSLSNSSISNSKSFSPSQTLPLSLSDPAVGWVRRWVGSGGLIWVSLTSLLHKTKAKPNPPLHRYFIPPTSEPVFFIHGRCTEE